MPAGEPMRKTIEAFKQTRWWGPCVARYKAHLDSCKEQGCEPDPFPRFVAEVLSTKNESVRDDMLAMPELEDVAPIQRYRQYDSPTRVEQHFGTARPRDKDRRR